MNAIFRIIITLAISIGAAAAISSRASANYSAWFCDGGSQFYSGNSIANSGTASTTDNLDGCGTMGTNQKYQLYPGSTQYWSGWAYDTHYAAVNPGNIGLFSYHRASGYGVWGPSVYTLTSS